jgi:hypothetical protein
MAVFGKMRLIRATTLLLIVSLMISMMGGSFASGKEVSWGLLSEENMATVNELCRVRYRTVPLATRNYLPTEII